MLYSGRGSTRPRIRFSRNESHLRLPRCETGGEEVRRATSAPLWPTNFHGSTAIHTYLYHRPTDWHELSTHSQTPMDRDTSFSSRPSECYKGDGAAQRRCRAGQDRVREPKAGSVKPPILTEPNKRRAAPACLGLIQQDNLCTTSQPAPHSLSLTTSRRLLRPFFS